MLGLSITKGLACFILCHFAFSGVSEWVFVAILGLLTTLKLENLLKTIVGRSLTILVDMTWGLAVIPSPGIFL